MRAHSLVVGRWLVLLTAGLACSTAQNPPLPDVTPDVPGDGDADVTVPDGDDVPDPPDGTDGDADGDADAPDDGPPPECESDLDCNDLVDCTSDSCDPTSGTCLNTPVDAVCDDGNACTTGELCDPTSGCVAGTPNTCADGIDCTTDLCDPFTGGCSNAPDHRACVPPQICVPADGGCVTPPPCTTAADCDDGDLCNGTEVCDPAVGCQPGTPVACRDTVDCTRDSCNPLTGACVNAPDDALCDNSNPCDGTESCNPASGCERGTAIDCSDGVDCTVDSCDPTSGRCAHSADDDLCNDSVFCNGVERCDAVAGCISGAVPSCSDGIGCTTDRCDGASDGCVNTPDNARCSDGQFCNGAETCSSAAGCVPGTPPTCDDGLSCTTDGCDPSGAGGAGACAAVSPDRDVDGYSDVACTGNDCNDGDNTIYPGAPEGCNGRDDNCDGGADEGFACVLGAARGCTVGSCSGSQTCQPGCTWTACTVAATESCNGVDDNCNGVADEGFGCVFGTTRGCAVGACAGTQSCVPGCSWGTCTVSATEVCNGIDDDCDAFTDEGFSCIPGRTQPCTIGACAGTQTCSSSCGWGSCVTSATESCNGADDDCDGATDEDFTCRLGATQACSNSCGAGGTQSCQAGSCTWGCCNAGSEICGNSCDDDCDGSVNEGCTASGDNCASTLTVAGTGGSYSGTTVGMTADYDPSCGYYTGVPDVVYAFTPSTSGTWQIDTNGSGFDTMLHVYGPPCLGSLLGCDDDAGDGAASLVSLSLSAGTTYYIVVDGYSTTGTYTLNVTRPTTLAPGDNCATSSGFITGSGTWTGNTCSYLHDYTPGCRSTSTAADVVYGLTVGYYREVIIDLYYSSYDTVLHVHQGSCTGTEVGCNDDYTGLSSYLDLYLDAGTYYIVIDGYSSACGAYQMDVYFY
jgi:hypothetical protein